MPTLDDLVAVTRPALAGSVQTPETLAVAPDTPARDVVDLLTEYFGEDDERSAVKLVVGGKEIGYLHRQHLYAVATASEKGIGSSDYGTLPGRPNYRLIRLRCPVDGCTQALLVTSFDEDDPPRCEVHSARSMEIAP